MMALGNFWFHHGSLSVADIDTSISWYQRVLGFKLENRFHVASVPADGAFLLNGDLRIELFSVQGSHPLASDRQDAARDIQTHGNKFLALSVDDPAGISARLADSGCRVTTFGPAFFVHDPDGNPIELIGRFDTDDGASQQAPLKGADEARDERIWLIRGTASVPNVDIAIAWYQEKLGFELLFKRYAESIGAHLAYVRRGDMMMSLVEVEGAQRLPDARRTPEEDLRTQGTKHVAFAIDPGTAEPFAQELIRLDVDIALRFRTDKGGVTFVRDPAGNLLEFLERSRPTGEAAYLPPLAQEQQEAPADLD